MTTEERIDAKKKPVSCLQVRNLIDISLPISAEMPTWPGSPPVSLSRLQPDANASIIETVLHFNTHTGTHIDAPLHFLPGAAAISQIPLDVILGPAPGAWLPDVDKITAKEMNGLSIPRGTRRLLLRTRNSDHWAVQCREFDRDFVALTPDAAEWVVDHSIQLLGVDALSVQGFGDGPQTHRILLAAGFVILEGLTLSGVSTGEYELICLPINLADAEAVPGRAIQRTKEES